MSSGSSPLVSVVIPTVARPSLARALDSVARQHGPFTVEVLVVVDLPHASVDLPSQVGAPHVRTLWSGGGRGGGAARNLGTSQARGEWVAYLDDDDEWEPGKLSAQLRAAAGVPAGVEPILSSRHRQAVEGGRTSAPLPAEVYEDGDVAAYLFLRRRPGGGRASIYTSTLMCRTELARRGDWDETLPRHQDWDWLISHAELDRARLIQLADPLVVIHVGSSGSISATTDWAASLDWARAVLPGRGAQVVSDFLAAQTLRYAIAAKSPVGVARVLLAIVATRRVPSAGPAVIALAGLFPRRWLENLMTVLR